MNALGNLQLGVVRPYTIRDTLDLAFPNGKKLLVQWHVTFVGSKEVGTNNKVGPFSPSTNYRYNCSLVYPSSIPSVYLSMSQDPKIGTGLPPTPVSCW